MAPTPEKPDAFLSYTRDDDDFLDGKITMFREHLERTVKAVTGRFFTVFQDINGIGLGEHWPEKLDEMIDQTTFFLPMVTPSYFESKPCREELKRFLDLELNAGRKDLILPIYCIKAELLEVETLRSEDELAVAIHERQHHDWRELLLAQFSTRKVKVALRELAEEINEAAKHHSIGPGSDSQESSTDSRPESSKRKEGASTRPGVIFRDVDASWCPEMVVIPAGTFDMGSPRNEAERHDDESPQHRVEIEKPFALGRYPLTCGEFAAFVRETGHEGRGAYAPDGKNFKLDEHADWQCPGILQTDRHPVVCVSYDDAMAYLAWLSDKTGRLYILPSEAMWEYACRSGTSSPFWTGDSISTDQANYDGNFPYKMGQDGEFRKVTTEVDLFAPNSFGLHDMHGNVWEWCADLWHENYEAAPANGSAWISGDSKRRVLRGGSWNREARSIRSACRNAVHPIRRDSLIGFRCARAIDDEPITKGAMTYGNLLDIKPIPHESDWSGKIRSD